MKKQLPITYFLLILSSAFWGVSFILTKQVFIVEPQMSVTLLVALRLALATAVTIPILSLTKKLEPIRKADLKWFLILAFTEPFVYHLFETSGVQYVSGSFASVDIATIPLFIPFGMAIVYKEKLKKNILTGVVMSFIGIAIMLIGGEAVSGSLKGILFLSGAVFTAIVYTLLLVKIVDNYSALTVTVWQNLFGLVYFVILLVIQNMIPNSGFHFSMLRSLNWGWDLIWPILTLGICCSTFAYMFYSLGVKRIGASQTCIFNNTIPIFSLIAGIAIGQESFAWTKLIGMLIVIVGVVISQRK